MNRIPFDEKVVQITKLLIAQSGLSDAEYDTIPYSQKANIDEAIRDVVVLFEGKVRRWVR